MIVTSPHRIIVRKFSDMYEIIMEFLNITNNEILIFCRWDLVEHLKWNYVNELTSVHRIRLEKYKLVRKMDRLHDFYPIMLIKTIQV
jgi:hypothetical protein